ncbi:MAG TPA: ankyrin repeat domain-containing protein, partial [Myxococcota bacterium]|nr:ankyrin repeat domain-containing protein [Myxococcota bacterium]
FSLLRTLPDDVARRATGAADTQGTTLLHLAVRGPGDVHWGLVEWLLERGAAPLAQDAKGRNCAHLFASHPDHPALGPLVGLILQRAPGAVCARLLRARDEAGRTPLHALALAGGTLGALELAPSLLSAPDNDGNTALHLAIQQAVGRPPRHRLACLDSLWRAAPRNVRNQAGQTPRRLADTLRVWLP